jgi:hypothetical protein
MKGMSVDLDHSPGRSALLPKESAVESSSSEDGIGVTPEPQGRLRRLSTNNRPYGKGGAAGAASVPVLSQSGSVPFPGRLATLPSSSETLAPLPQAGPSSGIRRQRHQSEVDVSIINGGRPGRRERHESMMNLGGSRGLGDDEPRKTIVVAEEEGKGVTRYVGLSILFIPSAPFLMSFRLSTFSNSATA